MDGWTEIVTHPLGLAGFALFIVFSLLARMGSSGRWPWLAPAAVTMAFIALLGGLGLAFRQSHQTAVQEKPDRAAGEKPISTEDSQTPGQTPPGQPTTIQQQTSGSQSPAVSNIQGDVNITIQGNQEQKR
jgi:hypothetical protein